MMMKLHEAAASIGVFPQGADTEFRAVGTDSRAVIPGMLFVALKGDRFDGHEFVRDVLAAGAVGAVVEHRCAMCHGAQLQMKNVRLDSAALLKQHAQAVYQQAVVLKLMPMNNATQITDAERALIGRWFNDGAKTE